MPRYDTNLASEFHVLACLHRLGMSTNLTLGNKKGVDVVVVRESGAAVTVEVKGLAGRYEWPASNLVDTKPLRPQDHSVALVGFENRTGDVSMPPPSVWIIPFPELEQFVSRYTNRSNMSRRKVLQNGERFRNAWSLIGG
ncbi:MAG: hypothetical protein EXR52_06135 [Dehalococcoidia bacterium]|nr:hypothetical protein [Dehalococcoidia bacterium]